MYRTNFGIGVGGREAKKLMLTFDRVGFRPAQSVPRGPDASEEGERTTVIQCEPCWCFARLGVGVFTERSERDNAAVSRLEPSAPMRTLGVSNIGDRCAAELRRSGHPPAGQHQLASPIRGIPHNGCHLIRENT